MTRSTLFAVAACLALQVPLAQAQYAGNARTSGAQDTAPPKVQCTQAGIAAPGRPCSVGAGTSIASASSGGELDCLLSGVCPQDDRPRTGA